MLIGSIIFLIHICLGILIYRWAEMEEVAKEVGYDEEDIVCLRTDFILCWPIKLLIQIVVGSYYAFKEHKDKE